MDEKNVELELCEKGLLSRREMDNLQRLEDDADEVDDVQEQRRIQFQ